MGKRAGDTAGTNSLPRLILASASPRRAALLRKAGVRFEVVVSGAEEPEEKPEGVPVEAWPMVLAFLKATAVRGQVGGNAKGETRRGKPPVILGADTIVVEGGRILNKARDRGHARRMLKSLIGKEHRVITGVALVRGEGAGGRVRLTSAEAVCRVRKVSDAWLETYLDSGLWKGKAGAYGIQDAPPHRDPFVELVSGAFETVVGLPVGLVQSELASFIKE